MAQSTTHLGYMGLPIAPRLHACTTCYCAKQHEGKSSKRENDVIKRHCKREIHESVIDITQHTVAQPTF